MLGLEWTGEFYVPGKSPERVAKDHEARYAFASQFVMSKRVLDIACGAGYGSSKLLQGGASRVDGVDIREDLIRHAQAAYENDRIRFHSGDICTFARGTYDVIVCFETIEHVPNYLDALRNLYRLLAIGGLLIVSSPNRTITSPYAHSMQDGLSNPFHVREFTVEELVAIMTGCGFSIGPKGVFGQRQRIVFNVHAVDRLYTALMKPDERADASVLPVSGWHVPRYFVLLASKFGA